MGAASSSDEEQETPEPEQRRVDMLCSFCPEVHSFVFINFFSDTDKRKYPADLAYVEAISDGVVHVRYYGDSNWGDRKDLDIPNKVVKFSKHWDLKGAELLKTLGIKKMSDTPSQDAVSQVWSKDQFLVNSGVFVPVRIPTPEHEHVWTSERASISGSFLSGSVIPACRRAMCARA